MKKLTFLQYFLVLTGLLSHALPPMAASAQGAINVEFKADGQIVNTLALDYLHAIARPVTVEVFEAHEKTEQGYRAFPAQPVFDKVFGKNWKKAQEIVFTSIDGYQSSIPVAKFLAHDAYLAFAHEDGTPFRLTNKLQNNESYSLGRSM